MCELLERKQSMQTGRGAQPSQRAAGSVRRPAAQPSQRTAGGVRRSAAQPSKGASGAPRRPAAQPSQRAAGSAQRPKQTRIKAGPLQRWRRKRAYRRQRIAALTPKQLAVYRRRRRMRYRRNIFRTLLSLLTALGVVLVSLLCMGMVAFRGPSQTFGDMLTVTMLETSALKFIPHIYYTNATVDAIVARNSIAAPTEDTDTSLINIDTGVSDDGQAAEDYKDIEVFEVSGGTFKGFMMIVRDPSRVSVGVCRKNFSKEPGLQLVEIAEKYGAVAAVNGGAFADDGGMGNGGKPKGIVVSEGELLYSSGGGSENVTVGFTQEDKLVIGEMTGEQAKKLGLRDAVTFGPALVVNGEACEVSGISSGLNPRTAIGQREDGAVLLLVIDGRQVNSMGATHADLMRIMMEYGAVNACNLDGGSSSIMYYEGKYLNNGVAVTGSRKIPTAIVVR